MTFLKLCHLVIPELTRIMIKRPKNEKPVAIFLMGPTASGKTDLAIELHKHLPVEIINVDSSQVYKGMDVGSAKPTEEILNKIRHRLINIRDPSEHCLLYTSDAADDSLRVNPGGRRKRQRDKQE
mgnify:CR=1 FL=1